MVLDDDADVRTTMERLLRAYGYRTVTAATLDEAKALLGATAIQALILDVKLQPGQRPRSPDDDSARTELIRRPS